MTMEYQGISRRDLLKGAAASAAGAAALAAASTVGAPQATAAESAASGTGSATVRGFGGDVTVTLTVENGTIVDAAVEGPNETPDRGGRACEVLQAAYVDAGNQDVEGVAGATVTSDAVKRAAAQAYAAATGAEVKAGEVHMAPGQYTASSVGYWGIWELPVTITVNETSILAIESPDARELQGETEGFYEPVRQILYPRILKHQSTAVDTLTGCTATSNAVFSAIDKALLQALEAGGSDASALEAFHTVPAKECEGQVEEIDADLVVVGLSTCGLLSMKAALDSLLKQSGRTQRIRIVGVEKCGKLGGQSFMTHSPNCVNPSRRFADLEDPTLYVIDPEEMRADWVAHTTGADGQCKAREDLIDLYINETGNTFDWLVYTNGWMMGNPNTKPEDFNTSGTFPQKTCFSYYGNYTSDTFYESNEDRRAVMLANYNKILQEVKGAGGQWLLETEGYEIMYDEAANRVTGVKARNLYTGKEYVINANAVIMSTGAFLNDPELQEQLYPENLRGEWKQNGNTQNTGAMVKAALAIGAAPYNADVCPICMEIGMPHHLEHFPINFNEGQITARTGRISTWTLNDIPLSMCCSCNSLAVGPDGNRVCNEFGIANGLGDHMPPETWIVGPYFYSIWSQDQIDDLAANGFSSANLLRGAAYIQRGGFPKDEPRPEMEECMQACLDEGLAWKADTLEDLAAQINVPAENLTATVERYNELCAKGIDEDFGKDPQWLATVGSGPYYAIKAMNVPYGGAGVFDVDTQLRALKDDHETPIGGLYIGGQDSFGCLGSPEANYITYGGVDQGWHILTGRLMGENAADYVYGNFGLLSERQA